MLRMLQPGLTRHGCLIDVTRSGHKLKNQKELEFVGDILSFLMIQTLAILIEIKT